jgi:hypothetical protein
MYHVSSDFIEHISYYSPKHLAGEEIFVLSKVKSSSKAYTRKIQLVWDKDLEPVLFLMDIHTT